MLTVILIPICALTPVHISIVTNGMAATADSITFSIVHYLLRERAKRS